jgi:anti-sigma factor RsiW
MDREFLISQYADGTITDADRAALQSLLSEDAGARELLAQEQRLTNFLSTAGAPLSMRAVDWDGLAARISSAVAEAQEPAPSYRLAAWWSPARLALAASVLVASAVGISVYTSMQHNSTAPAHHDHDVAVVTAPASVSIVTGPVAEAAPDGVSEVSIGPAPQVAGTSDVSRYSNDLVTRPARLVIASGINPPTSTDAYSLPY